MPTITDVEPLEDHGTVVLFRGIDTETHDEITFGADHRPALVLVHAIELRGTDILVHVEDWQVTRRQVHLSYLTGQALCGVPLPEGYDEHRSTVAPGTAHERCDDCAKVAQRISRD